MQAARRARGTDGSHNEWPEFLRDSGTVGEENPSATASPVTNPCLTPCMLTLRTDSPIFVAIDSISITLGIDELFVDLASEDGLKSTLDQEKWDAFIKNLLTFADADALKCAVMGSFGDTCNRQCRGDRLHGGRELAADLKEKVRIETCMALRSLDIFCISVDTMLSCVIVTPYKERG